MADKTVADKTSVVYRNVRPAGIGVCAALVVFFAGCGEEPTVPLDGGAEPVAPQAAFSVRIDCAVDIGKGGDLECEPAGGMNGESSGGPSHNLVVGSQHRYVRMGNAEPIVVGDSWLTDVYVQNLTLQPMGTLDGSTPHPDGVRVFFVDEPNNGVTVANHDGTATFLESGTQKYYEYSGDFLGEDEILEQGEVTGWKEWEFELNGATEFRFSVLVHAPVPDPDAIGVHLTRISAGSVHVCGDGSDGRVYCWGGNGSGQLGDSMVANRLTPTAVWAPPGVTLSNVSAGGSHTCAEGSDDKLYCWGGNSYGQLGNGTTNGVIFATAVSAPAQVTLVNPSLGEHHTCAESLDGDVYCWGRNNLGQLGNGDSGVTSSSVPVKVTGLPTGTKLSNLRAGYAHTCAEGSDGEVYCWGNNQYGQLGDGTASQRYHAVEVANLPTGVTLREPALGRHHTCALGSNGKIYCWGNNAYGQFGEGRTVVSSWVPLPATTSPGASIASLTAGQDFTCASVNGELRCWGRNYYGQAGVGTTTDRYLPSQVHAPVGVTLREPTAGPDFTCARGSDGKAYCWGRNASFNLGDGTGTDRLTPVIVAGTRGK